MTQNRTYVCIDLKSFYASVECKERGLNPMTTNLVVADPERSEKTICLAVSPSMKAFGIPGRCAGCSGYNWDYSNCRNWYEYVRG